MREQTAAEAYARVGLDVSVPELAWAHTSVLKYLDRGEVKLLNMRPHQLKALHSVVWNDDWGIFDEPGTGKSIVAQLALAYRISYGNKALLVMPPRLLPQFLAAMELALSTFPFKPHRLIEPPKGRAKLEAQWQAEGWPRLLAMSYAMFRQVARYTMRRPVAHKDGTESSKGCDDGPWQEHFAREYNYMICDEAQELLKIGSQISRSVYLWKEDSRGGIVPMTGTPIMNTPLDAYGLITLLNPKAYRDFKQFQYTHSAVETQDKFHSTVSWKNLDLLHLNLYQRASRTLKREALKHLPRSQVIEIPVEMEAWQKKLYKEMVNQRMLELPDKIIDLSTAQALRMACMRMVACPETYTGQDPGFDRNMPNALLETVDELLDKIGVDCIETDDAGLPLLDAGRKRRRKVILFAHFNDTILRLLHRYRDRGIVGLYGKTSPAEAARAVKAFQEDPHARLFATNAMAGGVGLNLQGFCSTAIYVEPLSVPGRFQQACDRIDRSGQDEPCTFYVLKVKGTSYVSLVNNMYKKAADVVTVNRDHDSLLKDLLGAA